MARQMGQRNRGEGRIFADDRPCDAGSDCMVSGVSNARDFLDCKIGHEDVVDLTGHAQGLFLRGIGSNLLFPVHLRTGKPADEEHFAAAHFVDSPFGPEALAFCILTRHGLMAVTQDASLAQMRFESETNHARR